MKVAVYNEGGQKKSEVTLSKAVFDVEANPTLLKEAIVRYNANQRVASATTKTRGLVSGGGKKPWRQKGTGRARVGSSRNPIWRGGGIVFGPLGTENYTKDTNKKQAQSSLIQLISLKAKGGRIISLEKLELKEAKTKALMKALSKLPIEGKLLLVTKDSDMSLVLASGNVPFIRTTSSSDLNVSDVLSADWMIMIGDALDQLTNRLKKVSK